MIPLPPNYELAPLPIEELKREVEKAGFEIRKSSPTEVFVDLDDEVGLDDWLDDSTRELVERLGSVEFRRTPSKSPGHYHGVVTLGKPLGQVERLLIGVCLGGDKKRALLNLKRILDGEPSERIDLFFERKEESE